MFNGENLTHTNNEILISVNVSVYYVLHIFLLVAIFLSKILTTF